MSLALEARDLVKRYPSGVIAVDGLALGVRSGEVMGLVGPNGAGKTTAISMMSTLLKPTSGSLSIFGVDVVGEPARVRELIGLVPQEIGLYPGLTGRENLIFFGRMQGLKGSRLSERVDECLSSVGLLKQADRIAGEYSGGMKRRANIAVGMLNEPKLLILDEPTVGIDAQSRNMILEHLELLADGGTTMIYTTHYMEEAARLCSRVGIMDEGRLVLEGEPQALCDNHSDCANLEELFLLLTGKHLRD